MDTNFLLPQLSLQESFVFSGTGNLIVQDLNQSLIFIPITIPNLELDEAWKVSLQAIAKSDNDNDLFAIGNTIPQSENPGEKKDNNNNDRATNTNTRIDELVAQPLEGSSSTPIQRSVQTVDLLGNNNTIRQESQQLVADLFFFEGEENNSNLGTFFEDVAQDLFLSSLQYAFQDIVIEGDNNLVEQTIDQTITAFVFLDEEKIENNIDLAQLSIQDIVVGNGTTIVDNNLISQDTTQSIALNFNFSNYPIFSTNWDGKIDVLSEVSFDPFISEILSEDTFEIATQTSVQDIFITGNNNFITQEQIQEISEGVGNSFGESHFINSWNRAVAEGTKGSKIQTLINSVENIVNSQDSGLNRPNSPVLAEPGIFNLTNEEIFGSAGETVTANVASKVISHAAFNNLVGFYTVADKAGGIDTDNDGIADIIPGEQGYTEAALAHAEDTILKRGQTESLEFSSGEIVVPFLLAQGGHLNEIPATVPNGVQAYFPYTAANADGIDHFRLFGNNTIGIEDLHGGGDEDFSDMVFQLDFA